MIRTVNEQYELKKYQRDLFFKTSMIFLFQMGTLMVLYFAQFGEEGTNKYIKPDTMSMIMRLLCCYLFHVTTYGDGVDSWQRLKFLKNQPEKFERNMLFVAFITTLYQFIATIVCEIINMLLITQ